MKQCAACGSELRECPTCGKEFPPKQSRHEYCSQLCYWRKDQEVVEIIHMPEFESFIKTKILTMRGDTISVKPLMRQAVDVLDLDFSNQRDWQKCYAAVADICRSLGGKEVGVSSKKGCIFQWEREK